jgi:hypothetical protein
MPESTAPESILEEAQRLIHGERNKNYGHPRDNFKEITNLWNGYLQGFDPSVGLNELDVANLMILMKVARAKDAGWHRDSYTDIAGYAGCAERLQEPIQVPLDETPQCLLADWGKELLAPTTATAPRVWHDWSALNGWVNYVAVGTKVRNPFGIIWTLNQLDYVANPVWLWSLAAGSPPFDPDKLRDGPFTEILPEASYAGHDPV